MYRAFSCVAHVYVHLAVICPNLINKEKEKLLSTMNAAACDTILLQKYKVR